MTRLLLLACAAAAALTVTPAAADQRYATRAPVVVSTGPSLPWLLQLGRKPAPVVTPRGAPVGVAVQRAPSAAAPTRTAGLFAPSRRSAQINPIYLPRNVAYSSKEKPGTIVIDTTQNFLYIIGTRGTARRYGVGTGKPGFEWAGRHKISRKAEWPDWYPPQEMIQREAKKGRYLPKYLPGGPENPMGARALYIGSTMYRIHGTNEPWTIGGAVSSGCIRMRNEDVVDLYGRASVGATVIVM